MRETRDQQMLRFCSDVHAELSVGYKPLAAHLDAGVDVVLAGDVGNIEDAWVYGHVHGGADARAHADGCVVQRHCIGYPTEKDEQRGLGTVRIAGGLVE